MGSSPSLESDPAGLSAAGEVLEAPCFAPPRLSLRRTCAAGAFSGSKGTALRTGMNVPSLNESATEAKYQIGEEIESHRIFQFELSKGIDIGY
jgi:hypothetical protein